MNDKKKITLVSLGVSRKEYPFLAGFKYVSTAGMHYINTLLIKNNFKTSMINQVIDELLNQVAVS